MSTSLIGFDLTATYTSLSPSGAGKQAPTLGQVYEDGLGKRYRFVKNNFTSDLAVGDVVFYDYANGTSTEVNRLGTGTTGINAMAGAAMGAIPTTKWGWIQIKGDGNALVNGDTNDVAKGDSLEGVSGQLYVVQSKAIGTNPDHPNFMTALAAETDGTATVVAVSINCDSW